LSVSFSPQGDRILSGDFLGGVRLWQFDGTDQPLGSHEGPAWSVAFSPHGDRILSGGSDGTVRLWQIRGAPASPPIQGYGDWFLSIAFSPNGDRVVAGGWGGMWLWQKDAPRG
jgi:WD40 repeat protein